MRPTGTLAAALGATFLLAMPAEAQDPWRIGFRAGLNLASPEISGTGIDTCGKTSFSGGVLVERRLGNGLSLESGVLVVQRRWDLEYEVLFGTGDSPETAYVRMRSESVMRSLELPVLLKATFGHGDLRPWVAAGPVLEIHLSSQSDTVVLEDGPGIEAGQAASSSTDDFYRNAVLGFEAAAGLDFRVAERTKIHLDVRGSPGLSNLLASAPPPNYSYDGRYVRSNDVRILAGVSFGL